MDDKKIFYLSSDFNEATSLNPFPQASQESPANPLATHHKQKIIQIFNYQLNQEEIDSDCEDKIKQYVKAGRNFEAGLLAMRYAYQCIDKLPREKIETFFLTFIRTIELTLNQHVVDAVLRMEEHETFHPIFRDIIALLEYLYRKEGSKERDDEEMLQAAIRAHAHFKEEHAKQFLQGHNVVGEKLPFQDLWIIFQTQYQLKGMVVVSRGQKIIFSQNALQFDYEEKDLIPFIEQCRAMDKPIELRNFKEDLNYPQHIVIFPLDEGKVMFIYRGENCQYFSLLERNMIELILDEMYKNIQRSPEEKLIKLTTPRFIVKRIDRDTAPLEVQKKVFQAYCRNYLWFFGLVAMRRLTEHTFVVIPESDPLPQYGEEPILAMMCLAKFPHDKLTWEELHLKANMLPKMIGSKEFLSISRVAQPQEEHALLASYVHKEGQWEQKAQIDPQNQRLIWRLLDRTNYEWDVLEDLDINRENTFIIGSLNIDPSIRKNPILFLSLMNEGFLFVDGRDVIFTTHIKVMSYIKMLFDKVEELSAAMDLSDPSIQQMLQRAFNYSPQEVKKYKERVFQKLKFMVFKIKTSFK